VACAAGCQDGPRLRIGAVLNESLIRELATAGWSDDSIPSLQYFDEPEMAAGTSE
jgi:hypothetical protein